MNSPELPPTKQYTAHQAEVAQQLAAAHAQLLQQEQTAIVAAAITSLSAQSPLFDRISTWLLGAAGAAAALAIPNMRDFVAAVGETGARTCLALLVTSLLAGLVARRLAILVQFQREFSTGLMSALADVNARFQHEYQQLTAAAEQAGVHPFQNPPDVMTLFNPMISCAPWFLRSLVRRSMLKGAGDVLMTHRKALNRFHWQGVWFGFQFLAFVAFIVAAAFFI